jgi:hypothetical protein
MSTDGGHLGWSFESWPFKDHSCHVCFKLAYWFLNCGFAGMIIEWSCTKFVNRLLIWNSRWPPWLDLILTHKSCIWPSNEHFCHVWFKSFCGFRKKDENVKFP